MRRTSARKGFTLVELLVVITIVLIVSAIVLPTVINAVNNRQVSEAARILQAALVGARDAAIRSNSPRGIRLIPDPTLTDPPFSAGAGAGANTLVYSRLISIEIPGDYSEGKISIGPMLPAATATFPPSYPAMLGGVYPYPDPVDNIQKVLMIEQSPYQGGYVVGGTAIPNPPTSWYWNIRVGDQIRINDSGAYYTVVGPCTVNPLHSSGANPELFVNVGAPGTTNPLLRAYYSDASLSSTITTRDNPEFLFVVNGQDDDKDGYVDEGFNGIDDNPYTSTTLGVTTSIYNGDIDEVLSSDGNTHYFSEWEQEKWLGSASGSILIDGGGGTDYPTQAWVNVNYQKMMHDLPYTIKRRPVPVEGARETSLPGSIVIDASTFLTTQERSRGLPIDPNSLTCDIMVNADGQVVPQTIYSTPASFNEPFFHFWLADRADVLPAVDQRTSDSSTTVPYLLPMPQGSPNYPNTNDKSPRFLQKDRMLVTMFTKSGLITTSTLENFDGTSTFVPFAQAQLGVRDAK